MLRLQRIQVPRSRKDPKVRAARSRRRAVPFSGVPLRYVKNTDAYRAKRCSRTTCLSKAVEVTGLGLLGTPSPA